MVLSSAGASDIIGVWSGLQLFGGPIGFRTYVFRYSLRQSSHGDVGMCFLLHLCFLYKNIRLRNTYMYAQYTRITVSLGVDIFPYAKKLKKTVK